MKRVVCGLGIIIMVTAIVSLGAYPAFGQQQADPRVTETDDAIEIRIPTSVVPQQAARGAQLTRFDPMKYTLGPDDLVEIEVMRHPEFSGTYPINQEGKLQYKFVGDIDVNGLTKLELEEKLSDVLKEYIVEPRVNVTVVEYLSKVFYVLGEVASPGKYYMRAETISVREAVFEAGLPLTSAAMRKARIITPKVSGKPKVKKVNLYEILYGGRLNKNVLMRPGDVLYVPSTIMAKIIKIISPPAQVIGVAAAGPESAEGGRSAAQALSGGVK